MVIVKQCISLEWIAYKYVGVPGVGFPVAIMLGPKWNFRGNDTFRVMNRLKHESQLSEGALSIMNQFLNCETPPVEAEYRSKTANQEIRNYLNQQKSSSGNNPTRAAGDDSY